MELERKRRNNRGMRPTRLQTEVGLGEASSTGVLLGGLGLAGYGLYKRGFTGIFTAGVGAALIYRFMQDNELLDGGLVRMLLNTEARPASVRSTVSIDRPIGEVYHRFRKLEQLPSIMEHVQRVEKLADGRYRWTAQIPKTDEEVTWKARIVEEVEGKRIVWRSIDGSDIHNQGVVEFRLGPHGETEVIATIEYRAPGGKVGQTVTNFLSAIPKQFVKENLRNFKRMMETGEMPTIEGQSNGKSNGKSHGDSHEESHGESDGKSIGKSNGQLKAPALPKLKNSTSLTTT